MTEDLLSVQASQSMTVLVDLDSTLCDTRHRHHLTPFEDPKSSWQDFADACSGDAVIEGTAQTVRMLAVGYKIRIVSGRVGALEKTIAWLKKERIPYDSIHLRQPEETEDNALFKESYLNHVRLDLKEVVVLALDDWPDVCEMYERNDVPALCVNPRYRDDPMAFFAKSASDSNSNESLSGMLGAAISNPSPIE